MTTPCSETECEIIESFLTYMEGSVEGDDRYGPGARAQADDGSSFSLSFSLGDASWLEVGLLADGTKVWVGFGSTDENAPTVVKEMLGEYNNSLSSMVQAGFQDASLDWSDPPVEESANPYRLVTPIATDELADLEFDDLRTKMERMLEGYLIALGPAIAREDEDDE